MSPQNDDVSLKHLLTVGPPASQADSAGSIPVIRSRGLPLIRTRFSRMSRLNGDQLRLDRALRGGPHNLRGRPRLALREPGVDGCRDRLVGHAAAVLIDQGSSGGESCPMRVIESGRLAPD